MKRLFAIFAVLMMCSICSVSACAAGKLKVTTKNLFVYYNEDNGYFFAKVENVGDEAIGVDSGDLVLFSEDDEIILSKSYVTTIPSYVVLEPGEHLYVKEYLWDSALKENSVADYKFSVSATQSKKTFATIPSEAKLERTETDDYIYVTFTNSLQQPVSDCYVVAAVYDTAGELVFVDTKSLSNIMVHTDSTLTARMAVDWALRDHYKLNGIEPASVEAMVYYFNK